MTRHRWAALLGVWLALSGSLAGQSPAVSPSTPLRGTRILRVVGVSWPGTSVTTLDTLVSRGQVVTSRIESFGRLVTWTIEPYLIALPLKPNCMPTLESLLPPDPTEQAAILYVLAANPDRCAGGQSFIGSGRAWVYAVMSTAIPHEFGHGLGLEHSGTVRVDAGVVTISDTDYDFTSAMAYGGGSLKCCYLPFSGFDAWRLGLIGLSDGLPAGDILADGTYELGDLHGTTETGRPRVLRIAPMAPDPVIALHTHPIDRLFLEYSKGDGIFVHVTWGIGHSAWLLDLHPDEGLAASKRARYALLPGQSRTISGVTITAGPQSTTTATVTVTGVPIPGTLKPPIPEWIRATQGLADTTLTWARSHTATSYRVWRGDYPLNPMSFAPIALVSDPVYVDGAADPNTDYLYMVSAINAVGESGWQPPARGRRTGGPAAPVDCVMSTWSVANIADGPFDGWRGALSIQRQQVLTIDWARSVVTPASNGGYPCGPTAATTTVTATETAGLVPPPQ